jgi:hypothetical protein
MTHPRPLSLFIFHDSIEEFMVSAYDADDAFDVIDEAYEKGCADELILSYLDEYPKDMVMTTKGRTAGQIAALGRRLVEHRSGTDHQMIKPNREIL